MRFLLIVSIFLLQGCTAIYSKALPLEREPFNANGKTVSVIYQLDFVEEQDCLLTPFMGWEACRKGSPKTKAAEMMRTLKQYGFAPHQATSGKAPDYLIRVTEKHQRYKGDEVMGYSILSSLTFGVVPVFSDHSPSTLRYEITRPGAGETHRQDAAVKVRTLGGIYPIVIGPFLNYPVLKKSLVIEHERALQNWIQGGVFE